jgi:hypothetical protein
VVFAAVDTVLLNALLNTEMATKPIQGSWRKTYQIWPISLTINADYSATVSDFAVNFVPGQNGQLNGTAQLHGTVHLWGSGGSSSPSRPT